MLAVGDPAPDFRGIDQNDREVALTALLQRGPVILYFYPRDFTPVCTREARFFKDVYEDLDQRGASIVGVSTDDAATHRRFCDQLGLPFSLLADEGGALARDYQVKARMRPGTKRVTYVIDRQRTVQGVFHYELRAKKHVDEVLACLERLGV